MKLLIMGGEKVANIEHALSARYQSGVVRIDTLKYLDELGDYLISGKSFERLLVIDNTFAQGSRVVTQSILREAIIDLAKTLSHIIEPFDIVFVITKPEFGLIIEEEMMEYGDHVKIVQVQGGYTVKLFEELCMKDINEIKSQYGLVKVTNLVNPAEEASIESSDLEGVDITQEEPENEGIYGDLEDVLPANENLLYEQDENQQGTYVPNFNEATEVDMTFPQAEYPEEEPIEPIEPPLSTPKEDYEDEQETTITPPLNPFEPNLYDKPTPTPIVEPTSPTQAAQPEIPKVSPIPPLKGKLGGLNLGKKESKPQEKKKIGLFNKKDQIKMPKAPTIPVTTPEKSVFDSSLYQQEVKNTLESSKLNPQELTQLKTMLGKLSDRRTTYIFTGLPNAGTSTMAYGVAEVLSKQGYNVLLVDCDTQNRSMSYINKDLFAMTHTTVETSSNLFAAITAPLTTTTVTHIVSQGFHVLTLGLDQDARPLNQVIDPIKFQRFTGIVREHYHFIIYDMPYDILMTLGVEVAFISDGIVFNAEANTNSLIKLMNYLANIENPEVRALMFTKLRIILNKHMKTTAYFGKNTNKQHEIFKQLDTLVETLTGMEAEYRFTDLNVIECVPYNAKFTNQWYTNFTPCKDAELENILINVLNGLVTL